MRVNTGYTLWYPAFTCMPGGVSKGDSGLCCCVPCLLSPINSLCWLCTGAPGLILFHISSSIFFFSSMESRCYNLNELSHISVLISSHRSFTHLALLTATTSTRSWWNIKATNTNSWQDLPNLKVRSSCGHLFRCWPLGGWTLTLPPRGVDFVVSSTYWPESSQQIRHSNSYFSPQTTWSTQTTICSV